MANNVAAKRYAKALFALSEGQNAVDEVHENLEALITLMDQSPEWRAFVLTPFGSLEKRDKLINEVLGKRTHPLTCRFIAFINQRHRIEILPSICEAWRKLYDASKGLLRALVISESTLDPGQAERITQKLSERFKKKIILSTDVDRSIIGGLKIIIGDYVYDYSIECQLQLLQKEMLRA